MRICGHHICARSCILYTSPEDVDTSGGIEILEGDIYHDDDVINILLLGTDERTDEFNENARADAIMVMSLNTCLLYTSRCV